MDQRRTRTSRAVQTDRVAQTDRADRRHRAWWRADRVRRATVATLTGERYPRDAGMATAEYAIVMIAAVGFAGLLIVILSSAEVREALTSLVRDALSV